MTRALSPKYLVIARGWHSFYQSAKEAAGLYDDLGLRGVQALVSASQGLGPR